MRSWLRSLAPVLLLAAAPATAQLGLVQTQAWSAAHPDLATEPEADASLGHALAVGDFDADGFDDLAIGVPRRTVVTNADAGEVLVLYGGPGGLGAEGHQLWSQASPGVVDAAEIGDYFGWALAAGDFDGDGDDDLAIGVPGEGFVGGDDAGAVNVLPGGPLGLSSDGDRLFHQNTTGIDDAVEAGDLFGYALTAGDFDDDGIDDLAIGVPTEDVEGAPAFTDLGALHVLFGTALGLDVAGARFYRPGDAVISPTVQPENGKHFGFALVAASILGGGLEVIAIGMPGATVGGDSDAGAVAMLANPAGGGIVFAYLTQDLSGDAEPDDRFGSALAIGNFDGDNNSELVVGSPGEDLPGAAEAGDVRVFRGIATESIEISLWTQDGVAGLESETGDNFGHAFAIGDFDADGHDDLVVGIPGEDYGVPGLDFGAGLVLYGGPFGLTPAGAQVLPLGVVQVEPDVAFGWSLAAGRFSGHSGSDLAISLPEVEIEGEPGAGAVRIYASIALFVDGFESGDTSEWSQEQP